MPHTQRKLGESGFYHVVAKGDGGQIIFESDKDRRQYLDYLVEAAATYNIRLHAYCLMNNHVHLLVQDAEQTLSQFMKQLSESYAMHLARRTGRVGRVFQRPFWSEPITDDSYYLCVLRYIHANPEPAGICKAQDYPWSSYQAYLSGSTFVETEFALKILGGVSQFEEFSASGSCYAKPFKYSKLTKHHTSDELLKIAITLLGKEKLLSLKTLAPSDRKPSLQLLYDYGFSEAEVSRLTGIGISSIHRALKS